MVLEEASVGFAGIGGSGGGPVLLHPAAPRREQRQNRDQRDSSCTECGHDRHPQATGVTYYDPGAPREHRMSETIKRRLIDQIGDSPTFVAEGSLLTGDVETPGPLVMCGIVRGDGRVGGTLRMAVTAEWHGEIHAQAAVIAGRISGRLVVENKLEVGATAVIRPHLGARRIAGPHGAGIRRTP